MPTRTHFSGIVPRLPAARTLAQAAGARSGAHDTELAPQHARVSKARDVSHLLRAVLHNGFQRH